LKKKKKSRVVGFRPRRRKKRTNTQRGKVRAVPMNRQTL